MKNRLELKILLLIILVLILGFGTYVILSIQRESAVLLEQQREKSRLFSETVMVGIRNVMLSGKAPYASELVNDARENLAFGTLKVFNRKVQEVFPDEGRGVISHAGDENVRRAIRTEMEVKLMKTDSLGEQFIRIEPLLNEPQCQACHTASHAVRGATRLSLNPQLMVAHSHDQRIEDVDGAKHFVAELLANTFAIAFRNIMLAGEGELMDTLILHAGALPFVDRIKVYDRFASVHFGDEETETVDEDTITIALERAVPFVFPERKKKILTWIIPLRNEDRCQVCHGSKSEWRGVMEIGINVSRLTMHPDTLERQLTEMLQSVIGVGFRSIMLVGKGSYARSFINEVREVSAVRDLRVFDKDGNERFVYITPDSLGLLITRTALEKDSVIETMQMINGEEYWIRYTPLHNEKRCQVCHGDDHTIRGVVAVTASMAQINATIRNNQIVSIIAGVITILLVWLVLRIFMKLVVVKPIGDLGTVVREVGSGNFSVSVAVTSKDEIGELGKRVNEMIIGLRERFHLEKFVSRQTVDYVQRASELGVKLGGERKHATVFFSDVRGFTAFSEKVQPEKVVSMLNNILSRQAAIVKQYGGDIDKYVGDELVAVFQGEGMADRAVTCAIEIQEIMRDVPQLTGDDIAIGIGINTGEMVMGAMGSEDRMDFTVIGDAVNLGARLCSAAGKGQILLSEFTAHLITLDAQIQLHRLPSISVKGKESPIQIFEARRKS